MQLRTATKLVGSSSKLLKVQEVIERGARRELIKETFSRTILQLSTTRYRLESFIWSAQTRQELSCFWNRANLHIGLSLVDDRTHVVLLKLKEQQ